MITGAHAIFYSKHADLDRAFLRDVIGLTHVDAGDGWLIFGLPPSEIAVHPAAESGGHQVYFLCDDIEAFVAAMKARGVATTPINLLPWGKLTRITLPGGGELGVYQPRHPRPAPMGAETAAAGSPHLRATDPAG